MTLPIGEYRFIFRLPLLRALIFSLLLHLLLLMPDPAVIRLRMMAASPGLQATLQAMPPPVPMAPASTLPAPSPVLPGKQHQPQKPPIAPATPNRAGNSAPGSELLDGPVDAEGLRIYRMALAVQARRYRQYPAAAQQAGWVGTVALRVTVLPSGAAVVAVAHSSGHAPLDEAALDTVRQAVLSAALPEALRGGGFSFVVPVGFSQE